MNRIPSDSSCGDNVTSSFELSTDSGTEDNEQSHDESYKGSPQAVSRYAYQNVSKPSTHLPRSVRAATGTTTSFLGTASAFKFLQLESYVCTCIAETPTSTNGYGSSMACCKVLQYFGMLFVKDMQAIFCPAHHCFVPMACWAQHVKRTHQDWISSTKVDECTRMAKHVALSCGLDPAQDTKDLQLPDKIDQPFGSYSTQTKSPIHLSSRCPKCSLWISEDKGSRQSDRYMRRHLRDTCSKGPSTDWKEIQLTEPCFTYRVSICRGKSHAFRLPADWEDATVTQEPAQPPYLLFPEDTIPSSSPRTVSQDWPFRVGWTSYDEDISASKHIQALHQLILRPKCGCRSNIQNPDFLEQGLHLVNHALIKYFKAAMMFVHKKHKSVIDAIVSE